MEALRQGTGTVGNFLLIAMIVTIELYMVFVAAISRINGYIEMLIQTQSLLCTTAFYVYLLYSTLNPYCLHTTLVVRLARVIALFVE